MSIMSEDWLHEQAPSELGSDQDEELPTLPGLMDISLSGLYSPGKKEKVCHHCATKESPMWRTGPEGKVLCNACGIYFAKYQKSRPVQLFTRDHDRVRKTRARKSLAEGSKRSVVIAEDDEKEEFLAVERQRIETHLRFLHEKTGAHFVVIEAPRESSEASGFVIISDTVAGQAVARLSAALGKPLTAPEFFLQERSPGDHSMVASTSSEPKVEMLQWLFRILSWLYDLMLPDYRARQERRVNGEVRAPGLLEYWYACQPNPRQFIMTVGLESSDVLPLEHVRQILAELVKRHPCLSMRFTVQKNHLEFLPVEGLTFETLPVKMEEDLSFHDVAEREANLTFDDTNPRIPLWRFFVVPGARGTRQYELVAVFHHIILDGVSGLVFFEEFFKIFESMSLQSAAQTPSEFVVNQGTMPPPLDYYLDLRPPAKVIVKKLLESKAEFYAGQDVVTPQDQLKTKVTSFTFPSERLDALLKACRQNGTTLHAAVIAAANFALAVTSQNPFINTKCENPISVRDTGKPVPQGTLGLFLCGASVKHTLSPSAKFWLLAVESKRQLQASLPEAYQTVGLLSFVPDVSRYLRDHSRSFKNERSDSLEISNLRAAPFRATYKSPRGAVQTVRFCHFTQPNHYWGPLFGLSLVTFGSVLYFSLNTPTPLVTEQQAAVFRDIFLLSLTHSITNPELQLNDLL